VLAGFLATVPMPRVDGHIVGSDGIAYYSILRSAVVDHDLDLANDYRLLGSPGWPVTPAGMAGCPFSVGAPLLWSPFFVLARIVSILLACFGHAPPVDGIGSISEGLVCVGSILYALAGLLLVHHTLRQVLRSEFAATAATLIVWWASPLIEYTLAEPSMSHGVSFFVNALFLHTWAGAREPSRARLAALGACAGLVALVRAQEAPIVLLPLADLAASVARDRRSVGRALGSAGWMLGCMFLVFLPQLLFWRTVYGSFITVPQGSGYMHWFSPEVLNVLFSTRHGLFAWHPALLMAIPGILLLARSDRRLALGVVTVLLVQLYVNAAASDWWAGDAFGGRRFSGVLAWLALPIGALAAAMEPKAMARAIAQVAMVALIGWNLLSFAQYRLGFVSRADALTWRQMTVDREELPVALAKRFLHAGARANTIAHR